MSRYGLEGWRGVVLGSLSPTDLPLTIPGGGGGQAAKDVILSFVYLCCFLSPTALPPPLPPARS